MPCFVLIFISFKVEVLFLFNSKFHTVTVKKTVFLSTFLCIYCKLCPDKFKFRHFLISFFSIFVPDDFAKRWFWLLFAYRIAHTKWTPNKYKKKSKAWEWQNFILLHAYEMTLIRMYFIYLLVSLGSRQILISHSKHFFYTWIMNTNYLLPLFILCEIFFSLHVQIRIALVKYSGHDYRL